LVIVGFSSSVTGSTLRGIITGFLDSWGCGGSGGGSSFLMTAVAVGRFDACCVFNKDCFGVVGVLVLA